MRRALVAVVGLVGFVSLLVGIGLRTIWLPDDSVTATATVSEPGVFLTTAPGLLEARGGPVTVEAEASGGGQVLLAVGQERDVQAYVEGQPGTTVTGFEAEDVSQLTTSPVAVPTPEPPADGQAPAEPPAPALPAPSTSDLWVQQSEGAGSATLEYAPAEGRRLLLLATGDGTSPAPDRLTLTWPQEVRTPWSTPLVVLGVVLLLAFAAASALMVKRERNARPAKNRRGRGAAAASGSRADSANDDDRDGDGDGDDPAYRDSDYDEPGYGDPGYADPGYRDPGYRDPGYRDPGYADTDYGEPGYADRPYDPGYDPEYADADGSLPWRRRDHRADDEPGDDPRGRTDRQEGGR